MRNTQIYLLKLNSPSDNVLRLWTGKSLHSLRHCSMKQMGSALVKMQQSVDALQERMGILQHIKEEFASVSTARVKETMEQDRGHQSRNTRLANDRGNVYNGHTRPLSPAAHGGFLKQRPAS